MPKIEFRDGERNVPDHVVALLAATGLDIGMLTYEEAMRRANAQPLNNLLREVQQKTVSDHLAAFSRGDDTWER